MNKLEKEICDYEIVLRKKSIFALILNYFKIKRINKLNKIKKTGLDAFDFLPEIKPTDKRMNDLVTACKIKHKSFFKIKAQDFILDKMFGNEVTYEIISSENKSLKSYNLDLMDKLEKQVNENDKLRLKAFE